MENSVFLSFFVSIALLSAYHIAHSNSSNTKVLSTSIPMAEALSFGFRHTHLLASHNKFSMRNRCVFFFSFFYHSPVFFRFIWNVGSNITYNSLHLYTLFFSFPPTITKRYTYTIFSLQVQMKNNEKRQMCGFSSLLVVYFSLFAPLFSKHGLLCWRTTYR